MNTVEWKVFDRVLENVAAEFKSNTLLVGGRFVFKHEEDEIKQIERFVEDGFIISDTDQFEALVGREIKPESYLIFELINELRSIAKERGIRVQSVEAAEIGCLPRWVLASEVDYKPWWSIAQSPSPGRK